MADSTFLRVSLCSKMRIHCSDESSREEAQDAKREASDQAHLPCERNRPNVRDRPRGQARRGVPHYFCRRREFAGLFAREAVSRRSLCRSCSKSFTTTGTYWSMKLTSPSPTWRLLVCSTSDPRRKRTRRRRLQGDAEARRHDPGSFTDQTAGLRVHRRP
jgi:hypothetical protein